MTAPDGRPTNAAFGFISMLIKMVQELKPDAVVVAFDCGKPKFRHDALAQYKVHRPPTADDLKVQFPMVRELLAALDVPVVEVEGWEGDDILGTIAAREAGSDQRVLLVTGDRDAFQLVTDDVSVVTTKKGLTDIAVYGPAEVLDRYGVTPQQVPDYLGLKGDTSDNIPGVPGVGEKTAAKLLQEYGSLDELLEHAAEVAGRVGESLRDHVDEARASRTVATIATDVPLTLNLDHVRFGTFDPAAVAEAFGKLRFSTLLERVLALQANGGGKGDGVERVDLPPPGADTTRQAAAGGRGTTPAERAGMATSSADVSTGLAGEISQAPEVSGEAAVEAVRRWVQGEARLGVALEQAGESLFGEERELGVAAPEGSAVLSGQDLSGGLGSLLSSARLATVDSKALLEEVCPPDEALPCDAAFSRVDSSRLFDVSLAAYLLESSRSSYELKALYPDYTGRPLPGPISGRSVAGPTSRATLELANELERRLEADGSIGCFRDIEMRLVPVLVCMERVGVGLDADVLCSLSEEVSGQVESLRRQIYELADCEFVIDSPKQLAEVLFTKLGLPPQKRTKTGYSTDASVLAALSPAHPIAEKIVAYRELTKLKSTYIDALPRLLGEDGRLHTSFNQTVAATGRLSSSNPNLQNIPVRTELGRRIRAAFVPARAGDLIVSADYSQIELRILAHLSEDDGLIAAFTSGADFHAATASRVFGVPLEELTPEHRRRAKAVNFGIVYGISAHGLSDSLGIERPEAQAMIDRYYAAYPGVRDFLDRTVAAAHRDGYAVTMFGRKRRIPELLSSNYNLRSFGERTAMNHPMQGSAADIMKLAMIEVDRRLNQEGFRSRMVLQVHDELVFEAPADELDQLEVMVREAMTGVVAMRVPLEVSVASGANWALAK
jgi:DNA polymerase-1